MSREDALEKIKDPKFYLENFVKIKGKKPGLIPFTLNEAQKDLFNTLNTATRVIILKCRQLGFSTAVTGYFYHKAITTPGTNTALIGYNSDLTSELLDKVKTFYASTPNELKPTIQYNSKYEITFPKINSKIIVLPSTENVGRGYTLHNALCVSGDTTVFGENGIPLNIKDVKEGDLIVNGNGGKSKVSRVIKKTPDKDMVSLDVVGCLDELKTTVDHKILTRRGWVEAGDIKKGDRIGFPYFQLRNRFTEINLDDFVDPKYKTRTKSGVIQFDRNFGEVCGWFAAEGSIVPGRTSFSVHIDEVEYLLPLLQETIGHAVNKISILYSKKSKTAVINVHSSPLAKFFVKHFGQGAKNKTISDAVWYWGWEFGYGFLKGVFQGDGYFPEDNRSVVLVSISPSLVHQVKKLLVSLRIGLANINSAFTNRYGVENQRRYNLVLSGPGNYKLRRKLGLEMPTYDNGRFRWIIENTPGTNYGWKTWLRGRTHYWMKVRSTKTNPKESFVYDISLDKEPHSFLTQAGVVHNCTELSSWEKASEKMMTLEASVPVSGQIVIESTPRGMSNLYHKMWMADNDYVKKEYGWWWGYTEEEIEIIRRRMNDPLKFAQEYELTFLSTGRAVFDPEIVAQMREKQLFVGDNITREDGSTSEVVVESGLRIYRQPIMGHFYVMGADVSEGVTGGDYSTVVIFDRTTGEEVAMFRGLISPDKFAEKIDEWGRRYNNALAVVEINNHGLTTITGLKHLMYPSMYFRPSKFEVMGSPYSEKMGWRTTKLTRPLLIDDLGQALRDGDLTLHSKELLDELTTFVYDKNNDMGAQDGFHDDLVMATGIAYQGFKVLYDKPLTQLHDSSSDHVNVGY